MEWGFLHLNHQLININIVINYISIFVVFCMRSHEDACIWQESKHWNWLSFIILDLSQIFSTCLKTESLNTAYVHEIILHNCLSIVEPRFNEVPTDWATWFGISRVRFNEFAGKQPKYSLYQGMINSCFCFVLFFLCGVTSRYPAAFWDRNDNCK